MTPAKSLDELIGALLQISGCSSTLLGVTEEMPNTVLDADNVFCPEIFVRSMSIEIKRQVNIALSRIEELEAALSASKANQAGKKGGAL